MVYRLILNLDKLLGEAGWRLGRRGWMQTQKPVVKLDDLHAEAAPGEIVADNIRTLQPIYTAALLEELKAFQVVDRIVELYQQGLLPLGRGRAGGNLFRYWKETASRIAEPDRRRLYLRVFGFATGQADVTPNREFDDLWRRFISSVASLNSQRESDDLTHDPNLIAAAQQEVRRAARELAANLSLNGQGWAGFAAKELQKQIGDSTNLLSAPEVRSAYGARDMWQVIEQVAAIDLGGAKNSARYRTMITSGVTIIGWLANNARKLTRAAHGQIIKPGIPRDPRRGRRGRPPTNPGDQDLIDACEEWLAVAGISDHQLNEFSNPPPKT